MDAVYLHNKYVEPVGYDVWGHLRRAGGLGVRQLEQGGRGHLGGARRPAAVRLFEGMCWVALDRGLRLGDKRSFPAPVARWLKVRDEIYEEVMPRGWDPERRHSSRPRLGRWTRRPADAAGRSSGPNDPRWLLDPATRSTAGRWPTDGLVYRYDARAAPDGLPGREGTFNMCSFWLVEVPRRAPATSGEARLLFEQMLGYANHLGLFAEQTGRVARPWATSRRRSPTWP